MTFATLDKMQLAECRRSYEQTPLILRAIGGRFGLDAAKVLHLARRHHWVRYEPPIDPAQWERDVQEAVAYAENEGIAQSLRAAIKDHWEGMPPRPSGPVQKHPARRAGQSRIRVHHDQVKQTKTSIAVESGIAAADTNVVSLFPGAVPPPPQAEIPPVDIFNVRTKAEQARLRIELGELRGAMSLHQLQSLQRTRSVIDDYEHYFRVYLRPQDYLERGEQADEVYQERLTQLRKQALTYIAPTERDTLAGALKTLVAARETVLGLERLVAGTANVRGTARQFFHPVDGAVLGQTDAADLSLLDVATLRQVKGAMHTLLGRRADAAEPPKPPVPESLDDLKPPGEPHE